jgi:hypothetical protein
MPALSGAERVGSLNIKNDVPAFKRAKREKL